VKDKHIRIRVEQCLALAKASNCPRRKFGALLLDPERNVILMDGYNGGPRGGGELCGGDVCLRDVLNVESGTRMESGFHCWVCTEANGGFGLIQFAEVSCRSRKLPLTLKRK